MYDNAGWTPGDSPFSSAASDGDNGYRGRGFDPMDAFKRWRGWADEMDPDAWFGGGGFGGERSEAKLDVYPAAC